MRNRIVLFTSDRGIKPATLAKAADAGSVVDRLSPVCTQLIVHLVELLLAPALSPRMDHLLPPLAVASF